MCNCSLSCSCKPVLIRPHHLSNGQTYTISSPGVYKFACDLNWIAPQSDYASAIEVASNDVTLEMCGFDLRQTNPNNEDPLDSTHIYFSVGIYVPVGVHNFILDGQGGSVVDFTYTGIRVREEFENVSISNLTVQGTGKTLKVFPSDVGGSRPRLEIGGIVAGGQSNLTQNYGFSLVNVKCLENLHRGATVLAKTKCVLVKSCEFSRNFNNLQHTLVALDFNDDNRDENGVVRGLLETAFYGVTVSDVIICNNHCTSNIYTGPPPFRAVISGLSWRKIDGFTVEDVRINNMSTVDTLNDNSQSPAELYAMAGSGTRGSTFRRIEITDLRAGQVQCWHISGNQGRIFPAPLQYYDNRQTLLEDVFLSNATSTTGNTIGFYFLYVNGANCRRLVVSNLYHSSATPETGSPFMLGIGIEGNSSASGSNVVIDECIVHNLETNTKQGFLVGISCQNYTNLCKVQNSVVSSIISTHPTPALSAGTGIYLGNDSGVINPGSNVSKYEALDCQTTNCATVGIQVNGPNSTVARCLVTNNGDDAIVLTNSALNSCVQENKTSNNGGYSVNVQGGSLHSLVLENVSYNDAEADTFEPASIPRQSATPISFPATPAPYTNLAFKNSP